MHPHGKPLPAISHVKNVLAMNGNFDLLLAHAQKSDLCCYQWLDVKITIASEQENEIKRNKNHFHTRHRTSQSTLLGSELKRA